MEAVLSNMAVRKWQMTDFKVLKWDHMKESALINESCICLNNMIHNGFPKKRGDMEEDLKCFWPFRDYLYTLENVPIYIDRMFIPMEIFLARYGHGSESEALPVLHMQQDGPVAEQGGFYSG